MTYDPVGQAVAGSQYYISANHDRRRAELEGIITGALGGLLGALLVGKLVHHSHTDHITPEIVSASRCGLCRAYDHDTARCTRAMHNPNVRPA